MIGTKTAAAVPVLVSFAISSTAPAGTPITGTYALMPGQTAQAQQTVPQDEDWYLFDLFAMATSATDPQIQPVKNAYPQGIAPPVSSLQISAGANKFKFNKTPISLPGGSTLGFLAVPTITSTAAATVIVYAKILRVPKAR